MPSTSYILFFLPVIIPRTTNWNILDQSYKSPLFILVSQEQYLGMIVYDVEATDEDTGINSIVDYSFETAQGDNVTRTPDFMINPITGVIRAERVFDREERERYTVSDLH